MRSSRGQSMVLFAFTLMLLTLMVMMTLGFGMKAKEKLELQLITDAAAYSNAVVTARALKGVEILNRAAVAVMVTMAATQSNISYASTYMGALTAIRDWIPIVTPVIALAVALNPACSVTLTRLGTLAVKVNQQYTDTYNDYYQADQMDHQAGLQARAIQGAATNVHTHQESIYNDAVGTNFIDNQALTQRIVNEAKQGHKWPDEYQVDVAASAVSNRELLTKGGPPTAGAGAGDGDFFALSPRNVSRELGVDAAMGSRGEPFVRDRGHGFYVSAKLFLDLGLALPEAILLTNEGSGHWSASLNKHPPPGAAPYASAADDEGSLTGFVGDITCPAVMPGLNVESWVISTDTSVDDDEHHWNGETNHSGGDITKHTMGDCTACPGVWTMFIDLNPAIVNSNTRKHLYGQPKNMAIVRRDTSARCGDAIYGGDCAGADPWNFFFNFKFNRAGAGQDFDNRGLKLTNGNDISNQIALGTGVTYYHRPGHWREPPNFFNPFWRGTLASVMVDEDGDPSTGTDVNATINNGGGASKGTANAVVNALKGQGYEGW
ncbi:MAG: hypothetical protein M3Y59_26095 [Myxococcota bacterium]|nr:hypothetical protein [Myxococcota bacterium]